MRPLPQTMVVPLRSQVAADGKGGNRNAACGGDHAPDGKGGNNNAPSGNHAIGGKDSTNNAPGGNNNVSGAAGNAARGISSSSGVRAIHPAEPTTTRVEAQRHQAVVSIQGG